MSAHHYEGFPMETARDYNGLSGPPGDETHPPAWDLFTISARFLHDFFPWAVRIYLLAGIQFHVTVPASRLFTTSPTVPLEMSRSPTETTKGPLSSHQPLPSHQPLLHTSCSLWQSPLPLSAHAHNHRPLRNARAGCSALHWVQWGTQHNRGRVPGQKKHTYKCSYVLPNLYVRVFMCLYLIQYSYKRSYVLPNSHVHSSVLPNLCAHMCACMCSQTCMAACMCSQICTWKKKKKVQRIYYTTVSYTTDIILPDLGTAE